MEPTHHGADKDADSRQRRVGVPRDLSEILILRGVTVSHECVRRCEATLLPVMGEALRCDLPVMQCWSKVLFGEFAKLVRNGAGKLQRD